MVPSGKFSKEDLIFEASTTVSGLDRGYDPREAKVLYDEAKRNERIAEGIYSARHILSVVYTRVERLKSEVDSWNG